MFADAYKGASVLVTGHTGFKGAWLSQWLLALGAKVTGLALEPETEVSLFGQLGLEHRMDSHIGNICDPALVQSVVDKAQPQYVFHLAAQPLVRRSYREPVSTYATNVMGTIHVLEALRTLRGPCAAVFVTTDKCYENPEDGIPLKETDPLGGHDPYSSSKGCAEIAIASWRRSFFPDDKPIAIASARAGNVIGGGDWAEDRIVPDIMRQIPRGQPIGLRSPHSTRPWQHVLEPLGGYLHLGAELMGTTSSELNVARIRAMCKTSTADAGSLIWASPTRIRAVRSAFNFGPEEESGRTVAELTEEALRHWAGSWQDHSGGAALHEAHLLQLDTARAAEVLGWHAVWDFAETVRQTVQWYRAVHEAPDCAAAVTNEQIGRYEVAAAQRWGWLRG